MIAPFPLAVTLQQTSMVARPVVAPDVPVESISPQVYRQRAHPPPVQRTHEPIPPLMRFRSDRVHKGVVEGLARISDWQQMEGFFRGSLVSETRDFRQVVGFPADPGKALWDFISARGEAGIKAHYALWARYFEVNPPPGQHVILSIDQLCRDLGYALHKHGGFRRDAKNEAAGLLQALTTAEIAVTYSADNKERRLRGVIWSRGLAAEERDEYGDLFGTARVGDPAFWEPVSFSYAPGPWFSDPEWTKKNAYVGMIGNGLMQLNTRHDRWAIRILGYLGTLARIEQYRPLRIRVQTILAKTGLGKLNSGHPLEKQQAFERAMERCVDVGGAANMAYDMDPLPEPDMDDQNDLIRLADLDDVPDWRRRIVVVEWPEPLAIRTAELEARESAARAREKGRLSRAAHPTVETRLPHRRDALTPPSRRAS